MKDLSNTNWGRKLADLDYHLHGWVIDSAGVNRRLCTSPVNGSGAINYFDSLTQLRTYHNEIIFIREMQELSESEFSERNYVRHEMKIYPYNGQANYNFARGIF